MIGDRIVWKAIKDEKLSRAHLPIPTVNFRTRYRAHYEFFGKTPPDGAKHAHIMVTPQGEYVSATISVTQTGRSPQTGCIPEPKRTRVSLCMIVKNEENHLADCLAPVAHLFDEIVVVDTGSTDGTKKIAARYGAKIIDFTWVDSFAAARNESLRHATGDWILWLDADDRLDEENLQKLRGLLSELPDENNAYMMCQWSVPDPTTGSPLVVDQVRLFRNLPEARWRYRVHEQIFLVLKENGTEIGTDIVIRHLGYQEAGQRRKEQDRNIRLLQLELEEKPCDAFILFNLANTYMDYGQAEKALPHLHRCIEYAPAGVSFLARTYLLLTVACHLLGRDDEALRHCRQGQQHCPQSADLLFQEGVLLLARQLWAGARQSFEKILALPPQRNYVGIDATMTGYRTRHNLALAYRGMGLWKKAEEQWLIIIEQTPHFGPAWLALVEQYLEQNRQSDIDQLLKKLEARPDHDAIMPALQARLKLAFGHINEARKVLEDAIIRSPKAVWLSLLLSDILMCVAKDEAAAERHLRAILVVSPNEPQAQLKLAQMLAARTK